MILMRFDKRIYKKNIMSRSVRNLSSRKTGWRKRANFSTRRIVKICKRDEGGVVGRQERRWERRERGWKIRARLVGCEPRKNSRSFQWRVFGALECIIPVKILVHFGFSVCIEPNSASNWKYFLINETASNHSQVIRYIHVHAANTQSQTMFASHTNIISKS